MLLGPWVLGSSGPVDSSTLEVRILMGPGSIGRDCNPLPLLPGPPHDPHKEGRGPRPIPPPPMLLGSEVGYCLRDDGRGRRHRKGRGDVSAPLPPPSTLLFPLTPPAPARGQGGDLHPRELVHQPPQGPVHATLVLRRRCPAGSYPPDVSLKSSTEGRRHLYVDISRSVDVS